MRLAGGRQPAAEMGDLDRHRLAQLVLAGGTHGPGQKPRQVRRRFAALVGTGLQKRLEPVVRVQSPQQDRLEHAKHHGRQLGAPDTAGPVVILAANHRVAQRAFRRIVIQRDGGVIQKDAEPRPVIFQTGEHFALGMR